MDAMPTANFTKIGNILLILLIALAAIWLANNIGFFGKAVSRRTTTTAA